MSRLIDADALCKACKSNGSKCTGKDCEVPGMPTIEAVPVVRCGECRHADDSLILWCSEHEKAVSRLDFCSYGKRKEADHEVSE